MKSRKPHSNQGHLAKLEMTPMIDVVFQLLIFFIVSLKERDILSQLAVSRPDVLHPLTSISFPLLTIQIDKSGWILNGHPIAGPQAQDQLSRQIARLASFDSNMHVVVKCKSDAPHAKLIQLLNICARENMPNISVFSL